MKFQNWPYLAGLFDGEGCVAATKYYLENQFDGRGNGPYSFYRCMMWTGIVNTNLDLMKWLIKNFRGVYYTRSKKEKDYWKTSYEWRPKGKANTEKFLLGILPHLVVKRQQALLALEWLRIPLGNNHIEEKTELVKKIQALNHRGKPVETNTLDIADKAMKIESDLISDDETEL